MKSILLETAIEKTIVYVYLSVCLSLLVLVGI